MLSRNSDINSGDTPLGDNANRQQIANAVLSNKNHSPTLWNACDFVLQFKVANSRQSNTAADYLSCLEVCEKEKLILRIKEEIQKRPLNYTSNQRESSDRNKSFTRKMIATLKNKSCNANNKHKITLLFNYQRFR